ncbi:late competence development ComFB family protein [Lysinibacillus sp. NPDC097195]|uniref:late competence development ComFB family protein n=1 Tax=Lysinibacillus sp. NPDC097195 TaxID=3364141 RepID=UPI0037F692A7
MSEPILVNVTEEIVRGLVSFLLRGPEYQTFCKCQSCEFETVALALNVLPSKYVTSMEARDEAFKALNTPENIELINREIIRALHVVNKYPRH